MREKLTPYYCKLPVNLKNKLEEQAQLERTSMVSILQELLILGLTARSRMKQDNMIQFNSVITEKNQIGFHQIDK